MTVIVHIILEKLFEVLRTPGIGNKLAAVLVGKHRGSSAAGIVAAVMLISGAALAQSRGVVVDWNMISTIATALFIGGRAMRGKKKNLPATKGRTEEPAVADKPAASNGGADLSKAETKRVETTEGTDSTEGKP